MDLTDKSQLIEYLKRHNLWAKKGLSQNFLVDKNALDKIVETAELTNSDFVVEIGPGLGVLTEKLIEKAGDIVSIELDKKLAELLNCHIAKLLGANSNKATKQYNNLKVINADILKLNLNEIIGDKPYKVVANIPYHITSKILQLFLSRENKPESMVLLVQKEVAERICASPRPENGRGKPGNMSILAISVQIYGQPEIIDIVPKESFFPSPKVDSAILRIKITGRVNHPRGELPIDPRGEDMDEKAFFRLVHVGFSARRKTLVNNLMAGYQLDRSVIIDIIKKIGLSENIRAQELSLKQWKKLLGAIHNER